MSAKECPTYKRVLIGVYLSQILRTCPEAWRMAVFCCSSAFRIKGENIKEGSGKSIDGRLKRLEKANWGNLLNWIKCRIKKYIFTLVGTG